MLCRQSSLLVEPTTVLVCNTQPLQHIHTHHACASITPASSPVGISGCLLCADSRGAWPAFWDARTVPQAGSEGRFTASVIGCTAYVLVAWVW
jgi:hypothetical protein